MRIVWALLLAACDAGTKPAPPAPSPAPAPLPVPDPAPPPIDAGTVGAVTIDAGAADTPVGDIVITWVVFPPSVPLKRDPQILQQPVTLEITAGGGKIMQETKLAPQFGGLQASNQSACHGDAYPLEQGELAKLTFYEGGAGGYFVKRAGDFLTISEWSQTDGACTNAKGDMIACPRTVKQVGKVLVKAKPNATVAEQILEVDEKGVRQPFDCGAK